MVELLKQITLLYVEDDDNIRPLLQRALERRVKKLYVAKDGREGYEMFIEHSPDIILTDIKMPRLNGIEMSRMIKTIKSDVPIIVLSAHSEANFFLECIELGIDAYLLKPIDKEKLLNLLYVNAKVILFEREKEKYEKTIETMIDLHPSIIFSCKDTTSILFVNKVFLEFFQNDKDETVEYLYDKLKKSKNVTIKGITEDVFWVDYIFLHPKEVFNIIISKNNINTEFIVKRKQIINEQEDENLMIITLTQL